MIISRTPFRISFLGGGSDFPDFYKENKGLILSTIIDIYCFIYIIKLPHIFDYKYRVRYLKREEKNNIKDIEHPSVRESLKFFNESASLDIVHHGDLPAMSGLGSSSSFTVGLVNNLNALQGKMVSKRVLADTAIKIEQEYIREAVGSQDQIAVAFGGFNKIEFENGTYKIEPILISKDDLNYFKDHLLLYFTGFQRNSSEITKNIVTDKIINRSILQELTSSSSEGISSLCNADIKGFSSIMNKQWELKKKLNPLASTDYIEEAYSAAISNGAYSAKILGAGGGGFMLLVAPKKYHSNLKNILGKQKFINFNFEQLGSQIIYYSHNDD